ncbi:MAG: DeoR/GlpR transcriptional regulator [Rhodospirillaceae bacterium]|nr:DeoR/GlpR transcriptional regulator [Rhodospirillaceae bacterium]
MWQEDRHRRIRSLLTTFGRISADHIASELSVSRETVRRDLLDLEASGALLRVRGGAVAINGEPEPPIAVRAKARVREKRSIARVASQQITAGQTVFLDAGSTTTFLAEALIRHSGLTIITNSVDVARKLGGDDGRARGNHVLLLGGEILNGLSATCGATTVSEIHRYRADIAMLSPVGFDAQYGATSFDPREADIARAMVANARSVVILADHAKIGLASRISYCPANGVSLLISDAKSGSMATLAEIRTKVRDILLAP